MLSVIYSGRRTSSSFNGKPVALIRMCTTGGDFVKSEKTKKMFGCYLVKVVKGILSV
jgi:hypothetical protein